MVKLTTKSLLRCLCMLLALFLIQGFQVSAVHAGGITEIVVFGDSLSDTGNLYLASGQKTPPSPPYFWGRFSNGPLWVERLASRLDHVVPPTPSLGFGLSPTNYAWGGAETGPGKTPSGIPNIGMQIGQFLAANTPTDSQLFVIWGGANDFLHATTPPDPADVVANIVDHISTIAAAAPGVELKFLVPNLPPLGLTPAALFMGVYTSSLLNDRSREFNALLSADLEELAGKLRITIMQLDIFSLAQEIRLNPADFGFTHTEGTARIGDPSGPPPDFTVGDGDVVPDPDEYVFFDDVHPTRAWHQIAGDRAFELVSERRPKPLHIDIRPFRRLNHIVPWKWSLIPVAILSDGGFNAVDEVVRGSLTFGLTGEEKSLAFCYSHGQDVNSDGIDDLICVFRTEKAGFHCNDSEGILKGRTVDGTSVKGSDSVRMGHCR